MVVRLRSCGISAALFMFVWAVLAAHPAAPAKGTYESPALDFVLGLAAPPATSRQVDLSTAQVWRILTDRSDLVVNVFAAGILSPVLHDHHFRPERWNGSIAFDPTRPEAVNLEVTVLADSLRNDQPVLSEEDHATVAEQVRGPDVLDVERFPEVRFVADRLEVGERSSSGAFETLSGRLHGNLTLRDRTQPLAFSIRVNWSDMHLTATGGVSFRQSAFGIQPYSRFLGTVRVRDEVRVEMEIEAAADR